MYASCVKCGGHVFFTFHRAYHLSRLVDINHAPVVTPEIAQKFGIHYDVPPKPKEEPMATTPVTPAVTPNKVESFFSRFGEVLKNIFNASANVALDTLPTIDPLLPLNLQAGYARLVNAAASQVAAADAKYALIGAGTVPFGVKVAEAVAVGGEGVLAIAAQEGLAISTDLPTFFAAAATIAQSLNVATITSTPAVPPATPPAAS